MSSPAEWLAGDVARIRTRAQSLKEQAEKLEAATGDVRHDVVGLRAAILALLDSLDHVDAKIEEIRQAGKGGG